MNKIKLLSLIILYASLQSVFANNDKQLLTGRVVDIENNEPIKNVELFISGATVGTTTNENGEFSLKTPFLPCHLVVMHVSYKSVVIPVTKSCTFPIKLSKVNHGIDEVRVKGKDMRKRNLRMFNEYFLWNTTKRQIQILNDSVLKFKRDEHDFHAYCNSPLIVRNNQLGYNVKILIQDFHVCKKEFRSGKKLELNSNGHGVFKLKAYHYYTKTGQFNSETLTKIEDNRREHYHGSLRHFLTSLYNGKLKENGFSIKVKEDSIRYPFVLTLAQKDSKKFKFNADKISVVYYEDFDDMPINLNYEFNGYRYHTSQFISLGQEFEVRSNGTSPHLVFEVKGAMGNNSPANTLPDDYCPK
ncbi:carboxypeptidase-like regulatory domain-containing protein [Labilibaculum sp. DW002]|uniref:Carboxypeptidase-like regulatory domain-containing protein n=1 Tax=Paralabilibaculum antarcticum TaxID=2912572 RepID=A0ABT5VX53_9BACT|nr:carboxypeptidase-like regulatory domain-containing protein [Labilibaculum sp. DW002]MDE5420008.1 carboxypeptidase-like regulatory domain-containing protein [Labilibaculum sp. DW002]